MLPLVARKSRWRYVVPLVCSSVAIGITLCVLVDRDLSWPIWTLFVIYCGSTVYYLQRIFDSTPSLLISEDGICDAHWNIGVISWTELSDAFLKTDSGVVYICLTLRDPVKFRSKIGQIGRIVNSAARQTGFGDFTVNPSSMGLDASEVYKIVNEQLRLRSGA
jgi:hypothetical protein